MLNLPIKILKTVQIEAETITVTIDNIDTLVAQWDAVARVTSRHLVIIINARSIDISDSITNFLRFNADAGGNYNYQRLSGVDAVASAGRVEGANAINLPPICGANNANTWGGSMVLIPHAFSATNHKAVLALGGAMEFAVEAVAARWASVAAITSVTVFEGVGDDFAVGTTVHLGVVDERYLVEEILLAADGQPTFDNIPQGEGDLAVIGYAKSGRVGVVDEVLHTVNDDGVAGNYPAQELTGIAAVVAAASPVNQECAIIPALLANPAQAFGSFVCVYSQYTKDNQPHFLAFGGFHQDNGFIAEIRAMSGRRTNIEPINKLHYEPSANSKAGSLFSLYRVPKRLIERQELAAPQATITFANIPQNFEALILHVYARSSEAAIGDEIAITINADGVAANYGFQELTAAVAVAAAARNAASQRLLYIPADNEGVGEYGGGSALLPAYAETDRHKHIVAFHAQQENRLAISSHRWESLNAIATIALSLVGGPNFLAGSVFELEGILRKEGLPPDEGMLWGV